MSSTNFTWSILEYFAPCIFPCEFCKVFQKNLSPLTCSKWTNSNTRKKCEMCSKLTTKTQQRHYWHHSGVFIVKFEHILLIFLVLRLLTLNRQMFAGSIKHLFTTYNPLYLSESLMKQFCLDYMLFFSKHVFYGRKGLKRKID